MQVVEQAQTQLTSPRINQDPRIKTAYDIYNSFVNDIIVIYKTTRAGCTTALVAETLNRGEQGLIIVPTNNIAEKTIIQDAKKYSDNKHDADIIHIPANHKCMLNEELIEEFPDIGRLPILPLADKCTECQNFDMCPVTAILRGEGKDCIVLTYDKLAALMMAAESRPNTQAEHIIDSISRCKNVMFDEIHEMQYGKSVSLTVFDNALRINYINMLKYMPIANEYRYIMSVILQFQQLLKDPQTVIAINEAFQGAESEDYWKKKLSITLDNKYCDIDFLAGCSETKAIMGIYTEIIELTKNRKQYDLEMKDIIIVYDMMRIILNERIVIHAIRDNGAIKVNVVAIDKMYTSMIRSFIMSIQNKCNRMLMTSATICSHDYDNYFMMDTQPKKVRFGPGGDPLNTNSKMLILADKKKYGTIGRNSLYKKMEEIVQKICTILDVYGDENCIIITLNVREANKIKEYLASIGKEHNVTYYKSSDTMGVSSEARIIIAVGVAEKPSNSFDAITNTKQDSLILREEALHCDTWQAWSRIKDPQAKESSIVFGLGCSVDQCKNIIKWGFGRTVTINNDGYKKITNVTLEGDMLTFPKVILCNSFESMLENANQHRTFKNALCQIENNRTICQNSPIINIIGESWQEVRIIYNVTKLELINKFLINRYDVFAEQTFDGRYFKVSNQISEQLIQNHINGKITIGSYSTSNSGTCKWICYDVDAHRAKDDTEEALIQKELKAEDDLNNLKTHLDKIGIEYLVESSGTPHSYHVWIFIQEVEVAKAYHFANMIAKAVGFDGEVNPKQRTWNKDNQYGNLVKLPFAFHQKQKVFSYIHGFDDETLDISVYDISGIEVPKSRKNRTKTSTVINMELNGVRPCIQNALNMQLTGDQGNKMRVAIVREFDSFGMKPDQIVDLFRQQSDFDIGITSDKVREVLKKEYRVWPQQTLLERCPRFLNCDECERYDCKGGN